MKTCLKCGGSAVTNFDTECQHDFGEAAVALATRLCGATDVLAAGEPPPAGHTWVRLDTNRAESLLVKTDHLYRAGR